MPNAPITADPEQQECAEQCSPIHKLQHADQWPTRTHHLDGFNNAVIHIKQTPEATNATDRHSVSLADEADMTAR